MFRRRSYTDQEREMRAVCFQTIDIFSGVTSRKLYLKDSTDATAWTDGNLVCVPFFDPNVYTLLEHEIGHILFRSDFVAALSFKTEYTRRIVAAAQAQGVKINSEKLMGFVGDLLNILEDRRINSLWGLLYPGSAVKLDRTMWEETQPYLDRAKYELRTFMICCAAGHSFPTANVFSRYERPFKDALSQVERRGFASTLALSKWLVARLLDGILEEHKLAQPTMSQSLFQTPPDPNANGGEKGDRDGGDGSQHNDEEPSSILAPPEGAEEEDGDEDEEEKEEVSGDDDEGEEVPESTTPSDDSSADMSRAEAMQELLDKAGMLPPTLAARINDFKAPKYPTRDDQRRSAQIARQVAQLDPNDGAGLDKLLEQDRRDMFEIVRNARETIRKPTNKDAYLTHGAKAKVVLNQIPPKPRVVPSSKDERLAQEQQDFEDTETIRRIRTVLHRIRGRHRNTLDEVGIEVDVQAVIERRLTGQDLPCFKHDVTGRGFRALILLDQSGSMRGERFQEAGRACRVISKSLKLPNVDFQVWGFASTPPNDEHGNIIKSGEVHIDRFDTQTEDYGDAKHMLTPIHTALLLARRDLEPFKDHRHIFVLTDGDPTFLTANGANMSEQTLRQAVRQEVTRARSHGIAVTAVVLGDLLRDKDVFFMYGTDWIRINEENFSKALVKLVTSSFINFVKRS